MDIAHSAQNILDAMLTFGWPIIAGFVLLMGLSGLIRGGYTSGENLAAAGWITGIISIFFGFLFLNVVGADLARVMMAQPAWGFYVGLVALSTVAAACYVAVRHVRMNRSSYSISDTASTETPTPAADSGTFVMICAIWLAAVLIAVVWLWRIAK